MAPHCVVVIGASAGGVQALKELIRGLPADFPGAVFVVLHLSPNGTSFLPDILSRAGLLDAEHPPDGTKIETGHIYVAPPDRHLVIEDSRAELTAAPKENRHRPAVDPLFRSAALAYGSKVVGVILTGTLDDGTAGLWEVKKRGGIAVVQDPSEARYPGMPRSAIQNVDVDYVVPLSEMATLLVSLCSQRCGSDDGN